MTPTPPLCFAISGFPLEQYQAELGMLEDRFTTFWSGVTNPTRLISRVRPFSFDPVRVRLMQAALPYEDLREILTLLTESPNGALATRIGQRWTVLMTAIRHLVDRAMVEAALARIRDGTPTDADLTTATTALQRVVWRWRILKQERRFFDVLEETVPPLMIDHYFLMWPNDYVNPAAFAGTLRDTFHARSVEQGPLPPLMRGQYRPTPTYLRPLTEGQPYLRVLTAYDIRGQWDLSSWHDLLMGGDEVCLMMDITTFSPLAADRALMNAYNEAELAVHGKYATKDARSERALRDVEYALHVQDYQRLHEVAYAILLSAPTLAQLEERTHHYRGAFGKRLSLDIVPGAQAEYLRFFTPASSKRIAAPIIRRNGVSEQIAAKMPWGLTKSDRLSGNLWGLDQYTKLPIMYDPFGEQGDENAHLIMWAKSGFGKTVAQGALAVRMAAAGHQVIVLDPVGKVRRPCNAAGIGKGSRYYRVQTESAINILDPAGATMADQLSHVKRKLEIILGRVRMGADGDIAYDPRPLSNTEIGALDTALQHPRLYGPHGERLAAMTPATAPLLADLVAVLRETVADEYPEAAGLAREIVSRALKSYAHIYNAPTTLRWDFDADLVGYNFKGANPELLPLYYDSAFSALNAYLRSPERKRRGQHLILVIDEYRYMAQIPSFRQEVAMATKTWRNLNAACWTGDQNAISAMGGAANASEVRAYLTNNTNIRFIGRQEGEDARLIAEAFHGILTASDLAYIMQAKPGQFVVILGTTNEVRHLQFELTGLEGHYLLRGNDDDDG